MASQLAQCPLHACIFQRLQTAIINAFCLLCRRRRNKRLFQGGVVTFFVVKLECFSSSTLDVRVKCSRASTRYNLNFYPKCKLKFLQQYSNQYPSRLLFSFSLFEEVTAAENYTLPTERPRPGRFTVVRKWRCFCYSTPDQKLEIKLGSKVVSLIRFLNMTSSVLILPILLQTVSCSCNLQKGFTSAEMLGALDPKF